MLTGRTPRTREWEASTDGFDATHLVEAVRPASGTVDVTSGVAWLMRCSLPVPAETARTAAVVQSLQARGMRLDNTGIIEALCLITAMPEYQLC
jgi:hypothetical protein